MKKLVYLLLLTTTIAFAQTSGITYQAVLYNPNGEELPGYDNIYSPLTDQQVCLRFSIIDQNGDLEYMEEVTIMTDSFGMVNTVIGSHSQVDGYATGFNNIVWDGNPKSLKVDLDIKGQCTMFEELSNQPFTYVPFALYSANPGNPGPQGEPGLDGQDGVGIASTVDNNDGTFTINYSDGSSFTTADLTGPQGAQGIQGEQGPIGPTGPQGVQGPPGNDGVDGLNGTDGADGQDGVGIASTVDNNDGTFTINYTDGSSFTTADLTGPQGAQGIQGEQGPIGPTGATGPQGIQGPPGNDGVDGLNGTDGQDGVGIASTVDNSDGTFTINYTDGSSFTTADLTGPQGIQGEQGPIGTTGATGPQGIQGPPGNDGADGMNGTDGDDGQDGVGIASTVDNNDGTFTINYTDGSSFTTADLTGPQGFQGEQGPIGPTGATGPQGIQGPPGNDGADGLNGTDGVDGQDGVGISSTVDNNDGTFTINYTDGSSFTTADLTGPQGAQGIQGEQGIQGPPGNDGIDGLNGTDGVDGQDGVGIASTVDNNDGTFTINYTDGSSFTTADITGPQGEQGPVGPTGLSGPQGVQGPPGNDGSDGLNGQDGADGLSAYDVWLSLGNTGTEQDFIDSLTGPSGNGIESTTDNGDGTFTFDYTDGTSFTTSDLTGPQGTSSVGSQVVITDSSNINSLSLDNGTIVYNRSDGTLYLYTNYGSSSSAGLITSSSQSSSNQSGNNFILSFKVSQELNIGGIDIIDPSSNVFNNGAITLFEDIDNDITNGIGIKLSSNGGTSSASRTYNAVLSPSYTYNVLIRNSAKNLPEAPNSSLVFDSNIFLNLVVYKTTSSVFTSDNNIPQSLQVSNTHPYALDIGYSIIDGSPSLIRIN